MFLIYVIVGGFTLLGMVVSSRLKNKFRKYSKMPLTAGLSGAEVAKRMLEYYNLYDVSIVEGRGFLSDHYNPATKTVSLSPDVFNGRHVSAAAVAAHECGHAVQHAEAYTMLQVRSAIVPFVNVAAQYQQYVLLAAFLMLNVSSVPLLLAVILFAMTTIFSVITLPVEFDASNRALAWLNNNHIAQGPEYSGAKDALKWAAMTYVVAALSSLAMLVYLVFRYLGSDR